MDSVEIICTNLSKSFSGKTIFKNLSFKISTAQSLTITGRNGSGKSTLIKILSSLIRSSGGSFSINVNGNAIANENHYLSIGMFSPYLNLYEELTGLENLQFFYRLKSGSDYDPGRSNFVLEKVGLFEKRNELFKNYSSGMKQRLKLAFAVISNPKILLMDEPRTNLDRSGIDLISEIAAEQKEKGILIIATNDEDDRELCDDTLNIEDYK